jgi:membrane fusion protein, multidrug efflux system
MQDMTEQSENPASRDTPPTPHADTPAAPAKSEQKFAASGTPARTASPMRKLLVGLLAIAVIAALVVFGIPWVKEMLNTVSTDDAYVDGHVTFVAPRVAGQISRVLVDDNNRVRKGDLIAELDKEPFEIAVSEKNAAVDTANADLLAAMAMARGIEAKARSARWQLQKAVQDVDNETSLLHARVAALDKSKAELTLAQLNFDRAQQLVHRADVTVADFDERQAELATAKAGVNQALAEVYQVRVSLGLPARPDAGAPLDQVPSDLDETFSTVLEAQAELIEDAAELGVQHSFSQGPKAMLDQFQRLGDIDVTFARYAAQAPAVKQAEAKLETAKRDLAQAQLNLRYCDIFADIDGVITRRNVNPGDYVQVGQGLMAIRSLTDIWIDANFKETQLGQLRIGQPADLYVDMYGDRHVFKGRISGFTMGTGSTLALLPAQNATGNFVKVVQRLPVRIDVENYDPNTLPLFIGSSVVPYVYIHEPATGPNAGKFLQADMTGLAAAPGAAQ